MLLIYTFVTEVTQPRRTNMATESDVWEAMPLVEFVATRLGIDSSLVADLGLEVLRSAALTHRPERGEFKPYAKLCLKSAMLSYQRKQGLVRLTESGQMNDFPVIESGETDSTNLDLPIDQLRELVSDEEYTLLHEWLVENTSRAVLEAKYGVIRSTLWVRVQKILKRVRKA